MDEVEGVAKEQAGSQTYQSEHMGMIFQDGFSFSGFERDVLALGDGAGRFTDVSAISGLDDPNDGRAALTADFDDDGDLDLVFADAGPLSFGLPGGMARLCLNDGTGVFTDDSARLGAIPKIGAQNAKVVDLEGDLDLDIVVDGKSGTTQVYFNDGAANFTLDTLIVPKATGSMTWGSYETEWADMDNDDDLDGMYMNFALSSPGVVLADAPLQNLLTETGLLRFVADPTQMVGDNAQDENDFALYDADNDGDLDVLVSVLTPDVEEKLFLNSGTFGPGFMTQVPGAFTSFDDSSLDLALADFDFDGDQDVVSAQGENPFGAEDFQNRYYTNSGPADTIAPRIPRVTPLPSTLSFAQVQAGPVMRAWVQDAVVDDNNPYADVALTWVVQQGGQMTPGSVPMDYVGGGLRRARLALGAVPDLLGATVDVQVSAIDRAGNVGTSSQQSFLVCGVESTYCTAKANSQGCVPVVGWTGSPSASDPTSFSITADMVLNNKNGLLFYGYQGPSNVPFLGGTLCLAPPLRRLSVQNSAGNPPPNDCSGQYAFDFNAHVQSGVDPLLVSGARINAQWWSRDPAQADGTGAGLTDAIEFWICD